MDFLNLDDSAPAAPPSSAAMRCSRTSLVGFEKRGGVALLRLVEEAHAAVDVAELAMRRRREGLPRTL
jgi:hypothetical protein